MDYRKIIDLVHTTRPMILKGSKTLEVKKKGPADFVTQVDFMVQSNIIGELKMRYPNVQIMSEEKENRDIDFTKPVWILDPIDGTTNLVHNFHHSAVSLAFYNGSELDFGIIYNPYNEETFYAIANKGCYMNDERVFVSNETLLKDSLIMVGTASYYKEMGRNIFSDIVEVYMQCQDVRRTGSAALDLAYVACGRVEGFFERRLKPWDIAAGMLLVKEAGGKVSSFDGKELLLDKNNDIVAGNKEIHEKILKIIRQE
ncbi:MAG: inositol monophosphatase [Clostridiaceae bacterium]